MDSKTGIKLPKLKNDTLEAKKAYAKINSYFRVVYSELLSKERAILKKSYPDPEKFKQAFEKRKIDLQKIARTQANSIIISRSKGVTSKKVCSVSFNAQLRTERARKKRLALAKSRRK
jgi:5'-3' exonuclease